MCPIQEFEVFFIDPLSIDGAIKRVTSVDAEIDGSFLNVADGFNHRLEW